MAYPDPASQAHETAWINLHIGVHFAGAAYLPESLNANEGLLKKTGMHAPSPRQARAAILGMIDQLDGLPPILPEEEAVLSRLRGDTGARNLFMFDDRWAAPLRSAFNGDILYSEIDERVLPVAELFASSKLQISLSLLNPGVFLNNSLSSEPAEKHVRDFIKRIDPETLRWRDTVAKLRKALPDVPLLLWCEEDAPLIWPDVLRHLFNLPDDCPVLARLAPLRPLIEKEGFIRLETYLRKHPPETRAQYEQVIMLFLDKYGKHEALIPHCDVPSCNAETLEIMSANYEEDVAYLAQQDGITFLLPEIHA